MEYITEKEINKYITLKLVGGRTYIYVNGKRFIQCIRLILNIPKDDVYKYDEVDSIDEAAKLYSKNLFQNRIVRGPMARPVANQGHDVTAEQEFWGHCSNIQAWVEHDYDTRILMSNISFPLLRELSRAGDPLAKKVFKEEIAERLESGYPNVVQYLILQGYISNFTPSEFKTILETTDIIKNLPSNTFTLIRFIQSCASKFPDSLGDVLLEILKLPQGKSILTSCFSQHLRRIIKFLPAIKKSLEDLLSRVDEDTHTDIIKISTVIDDTITKGKSYGMAEGSRAELLRKFILLGNINDPAEFNQIQAGLGENFQLQEKFFKKFQKFQSKCPYCGKIIQEGQDTCDWCGHKRDDDDGFFPYPFIYKPPGGGGGLNKHAIAISIKV
ncbi:MAG: zinc ribbon domain-containing protein [Promethearchaeota archaeon]|jgi:hypothetical protein